MKRGIEMMEQDAAVAAANASMASAMAATGSQMMSTMQMMPADPSVAAPPQQKKLKVEEPSKVLHVRYSTTARLSLNLYQQPTFGHHRRGNFGTGYPFRSCN